MIDRDGALLLLAILSLLAVLVGEPRPAALIIGGLGAITVLFDIIRRIER